MKYTGNVTLYSLHRQRGVFRLIHSLLIVTIVVGLVVLYKGGKLGFLRDLPPYFNNLLHFNRTNNHTTNNTNTDEPSALFRFNQAQSADEQPVERRSEDRSFDQNARFAVQVAAGYDSRQLFAWRDELVNHGYEAYLVSLSTAQGMQFKLRVGAYTNRADAEAMRDSLRRRYAQNFANSFVIQGN